MPTDEIPVLSVPEVTAATWACIRQGRLLVVRPRGQSAFYLPGGTPEPGETPAETTVREVAEETDICLSPPELTLFAEVVAPAYGRPHTNVRLVCFTAASDQEPRAAAEIEEIAWFTAADSDRCAPAIQLIVARLVEAGQLPAGPSAISGADR